MEKKIREEILGDKADEIREEIWQKERYAERESQKLAKNEKVKEKLIELFTAIQVAREEITVNEDLQKAYRENISNMDIENVIRESIVVIDVFTEEEKTIKEILDLFDNYIYLEFNKTNILKQEVLTPCENKKT